MKFSQLVFFVICLNLIIVIGNASLNHNDITLTITEFESSFETIAGDNLDFISESANTDNWFGRVTSVLVSALQNTINLAAMSLKIVGFLLKNIFFFPVSIFLDESHYLFKMLGAIGWLVVMFVNINSITKLYSYMKGSDN